MSRTSSYAMLVIIVLAVLFFLFGVIHLFIKFLIKRSVCSSIAQSNTYQDSLGSQSLQRQLHQLFRLHDSGLDQSLIDALPVFFYKEIMGSKEPFDCAVCLCAFSGSDLLRLLPMCSHAFHMNCIDTWLLSNSTCPLCRQVISSEISVDNSVINHDQLREQLNVFSRDSSVEVPRTQMDGNEGVETGEMRVFSVRLGKLRSVNIGESNEIDQGETSSSSNLDARRCYSMGTFKYVVGDSELQVALSSNDIGAGSFRIIKKGHDHGANNADREEKKISSRTRGGDSFSVSKIWLWSKRSKFPKLADTNSRLTPLDIV